MSIIRPVLWFRIAGVAIFALVFVFPPIALGVRCFQSETESAAWAFRWLLLGKSIGLAITASISAVILALPVARIVGGRSGRSSAVRLACLATLLSPPMVYAFGWQRLIPAPAAGDFHEWRSYACCVAVWSLWTWPIPAWIVGAAWSRSAAHLHEAARLDSSPVQTMLRVTLPILIRPLTLSGLLLFSLFLGEYTVPHAWALRVYATEVLSWATSSLDPVDTLRPAWPTLGVNTLGVITTICLWRWATAPSEGDSRDDSPRFRDGLLALGYFVVAWIAPMGGLVLNASTTRAFGEAVTVYGGDLAWSIALAAAAGAFSIVLGVCVAQYRGVAGVALIGSAVVGCCPGALVGLAAVAAFNRDALAVIYDHAPIVAIAYVMRFGWIGVAAGIVARRQTPVALIDQAKVDGASRSAIWRSVVVPGQLPLLAAAACVIAALSAADVAASTLVRVPSFNPIAHVIIEKFHRLEDDMLIALCACLAGFSVLAVGVVMVLARGIGAGVEREASTSMG